MSWRLAVGLPVGRGGGFHPGALGNLALWLDASQITGLNDGDAVATWADLSGNGKDATQATGTKRPTYKTGIQNGKPAVRCDGGDVLAFASLFAVNPTAISVFVVASFSASGVEHIPLDVGGGGTTNGNWSFYRDTSNRMAFVGWGNVGAVQSRSGATTGDCRVYGAVWDTSLATNEALLYLNGAVQSVVSNNNNTAAIASLSGAVGGRGATPTLGAQGDLFEVLVYGSALTTTQRQQVESYLLAKYGLS